MLVSEAEAIYFQASMLEKRFFFCIGSNRNRNGGQESDEELKRHVQGVLDFVHPQLKPFTEQIHRNYAHVFATTAGASGGPAVTDGTSSEDLNIHYHVKELEIRLKMIDKLC